MRADRTAVTVCTQKDKGINDRFQGESLDAGDQSSRKDQQQEERIRRKRPGW